MSGSGAGRDAGTGSDAASSAPAEALSGVWLLLDELPRGAASARLMATTIEMAAVGPAAAPPATGLSRARAWLGPAAVVAAALVAGLVAGRVTAPDPDRRLIEHLPLVRHLDLVREAGSVTFLEEAAGRGGPPLRLVLRQGPDAARQDASDYAADLDSLAELLRADAAARRTFVAGLPVEERAELERSLRRFTGLSGAERKTLAAVAEAIADPSRPHLRAAALDWHRWLMASRPEDREDIVASGTDKRLDWIDWYAARLEGRGRAGPPDRPPGMRRPPGGEFPRPLDGRFRRPLPPRDEPRPPAEPPAAAPAGQPTLTPDGAAPPPETRAAPD